MEDRQSWRQRMFPWLFREKKPPFPDTTGYRIETWETWKSRKAYEVRVYTPDDKCIYSDYWFSKKTCMKYAKTKIKDHAAKAQAKDGPREVLYT